MASCDVETSRTYLLYLTEQEAKYIARRLQVAPGTINEDEADRTIRNRIHEALSNSLIRFGALVGT